MDMMPVGHDLGVRHDIGGAVHQVRVGATVHELTAREYAAWTSRTELDSLVSRGLLASVTDPVAFARTHRLLPLALGLGNTPDEPWLFSAGPLDQPVAVMTGALYDLWQWAHLAPDLWTACVEAAAVAVEAGTTDTDQTDPAAVLDGALAALPTLLSARVACFDVPEGVS